MNVQYVLSEYLDRALAQAEYDKLEDGAFSGRIPSCIGVIAFGSTLKECENELRSTAQHRRRHRRKTTSVRPKRI